MRSHKLLTFLLCLITDPAIAGYMTLLGAGTGLSPVVTWTAPDAFPSSVLTITRASSGTYFNSSGVITVAGNDTARIDYNPSTLTPAGLLIEESRVNSVINNTNPAVWSVSGVTNITGITDPQALTKAATITAGAGAGYHYTFQTGATASAAQARVISVYVKQGTAAYVNFGASGDASWHTGWMKWSDFSTGSTNGTISVQQCANGYYRLSLAFTMTNAVPVLPYVGPDTAPRATAPNYTATGTETVIAWGLQDEPGTMSTSLIITAGSAAARQGDLITPTSTFLTALQATTGTLIVQVADSGGFGATGAVLVGSTSDYWLNLLGAQIYSRSGGVNLNTNNFAVAGSPYRAGISWTTGSRSIVMNGGVVITDTASGLGVQSPYLGSLAGNFYLNGHITSFAGYNKKLPDNILQAKSVLNASYANSNYKTYTFMNDNAPLSWRISL